MKAQMNRIDKAFIGIIGHTDHVKCSCCITLAKLWALEFATYMEDEAEQFDKQEQYTHSLDEHYENFTNNYEDRTHQTTR